MIQNTEWGGQSARRQAGMQADGAAARSLALFSLTAGWGAADVFSDLTNYWNLLIL